MAAQSILRRWKPFYNTFSSIDAAIEAANPDLCRDEFRRCRSDIVELLCDTADDDQAERLRVVLDDVMAEALETLQLVPAMATMLASTDLAKAVGDLRHHDSERVRLLASGIMNSWKASIQDELEKARAAMEKLDQTPLVMEIKKRPAARIQESRENKTASILGCDRAKRTKAAKPPLHKNRVSIAGSDDVKSGTMDAPPAVGVIRGDRVMLPGSDDAKMATMKRKFHQAYQDADNAKRQRRIKVVEAPEMTRQRQRNKHPIMRERSRMHCASSMIKKTITVSRLRTT